MQGRAAELQNGHMYDWNDLRFLLAVERSGSTIAAAAALGVNQSTVQRRLAELERRLGLPLVQRHPSGYRLTEFGSSLLPYATAVEQSAEALARFVAGARRDLSGVVRVTCPEPLVYRITQSPLLARFAARYPGIKVEFVMSDRYLDLAKGEADIALRSGDTDDGALVGRRIGDSLWALYASRGYVETHGRPRDVGALAAHPLVGFEPSMTGHRASRWLLRTVPDAAIVARSDSVLGLVSSAKAGIGIAALPTALGDAEPDLVRVLGPIDELSRHWRVLVTPELRHVPRVAAFFDFVVEEIDTLKPVLTG